MPHPATTKQPSAQSDYLGKKANNKEEKSAASEGHTPPKTGNAGLRTDLTPSPPSRSSTLR
ncbi:hypothetical protein TIFTF001_052542, partial [Ficus carica]